MENSSGGAVSPGGEPVLPIFVQMNARLVEEEDQWREVSRWVKFQEDVEDGGKRWSKPYVPSCAFSVMGALRDLLETHTILLNCAAANIHDIVDEILKEDQYSSLDPGQVHLVKQLFTQGVKQKMKMSLARHVSKSTGGLGGWSPGVLGGSSKGPDLAVQQDEDDGGLGGWSPGVLGGSSKGPEPAVQQDKNDVRRNKSAPTSPELLRRMQEDDKELFEDMGAEETPKRRHLSLGSPLLRPETSPLRSDRKVSYKDETIKYREFNLFSKKVPRDAEAANIQVATCNFLDEPIFAFVRLKRPVLLEDFCEISKPTRFLVLILGPGGSGDHYMKIGRAVGSLLTDQIFCGQTAYHCENTEQMVRGLDMYLQELTVLPPSAWDPTIRLDPPKATQSLQKRLENRATLRKRHLTTDSVDGGEEYNSVKEEKVNHREDDGLQFTGRFCGGLMDDIRRKWPWYLSDFTDALHVQTLASIIYIYLATVTKAITFGGFLSDVTDGLQGVLESFLGHALAGGVFCLFGGQPLTVLGCTGPVLIFEKILIGFCSSNGFDYLTMRLWIGLWCALFCFIIVAIDGSAIVRYFTRFTEEAFAALVGIIFIVESFKKIIYVGKEFKVNKGYDPDRITEDSCTCSPPSTHQIYLSGESTLNFVQNLNISSTRYDEQGNATVSTEDVGWGNLTISQCKMLQGELEGESCSYVPDIFFFSVLLFFGTFFLCSFLKKFKFSPFFPTKVRSLISDYSVILTIIIFVFVDIYFNLATQKLLVPTIFKPTRSDVRDWFIPFTDAHSPWYIYILACIPALLLTILLFMDQQITSVIVNRKEHKLKKGAGYHLDMLVVGLMMAVCSLLGLPWCVAATVLCLGHVDSLKMDTESSAPGETPKFLGIREQRVTGTMVFILTGLSVKLAPVLKYIPMPVLYGVLLYMGVNTLNGMQFVDRLFLLFMPSKHQPDYMFLRHVPLKKVHLFTLVQAGALAGLWVIKSTQASLVFPLMVLALVGFRKIMDFFPSVFSQRDLFWLDNLMPQSNKEKKKKKKKKKSRKGWKNGKLEVGFKTELHQEKIFENGTDEELACLKSNGTNGIDKL